MYNLIPENNMITVTTIKMFKANSKRLMQHAEWVQSYPDNIYLFRVNNNRNTRKRCEYVQS